MSWTFKCQVSVNELFCGELKRMQREALTALAGSPTCSAFACTVGKLTAVSQPCYYQLVSI